MYPAIERWYTSKVLPGIRRDERVAFVGYLDEKPLVSAVVKKGAHAKFCHLSIDDSVRHAHLGEIFFSLMAFEVRDLAKTAYFTLPQSVWHEKDAFFRSFGFLDVCSSERQYRLFDQELHSTAPFSRVWQCSIQKMPKLAQTYSIGGFCPDNQLLLSVHPRYAEDILKRRKRVEIRRRFSTKWFGCRVNLYAASPVMSLIGEARIAGIVRDSPERIWDRFQGELGCTRAEFDAYVRGATEIYAIELDDIRPYKDRISIVQASQMLGEKLVPPRSFLTLESSKPWAKAVSLAAYLHACFKSVLSLAVDLGHLSPRPMTVKRPRALPSPRVLSQSEFPGLRSTVREQ
jgi:predicted transcriptional regulator